MNQRTLNVGGRITVRWLVSRLELTNEGNIIYFIEAV